MSGFGRKRKRSIEREIHKTVNKQVTYLESDDESKAAHRRVKRFPPGMCKCVLRKQSVFSIFTLVCGLWTAWTSSGLYGGACQNFIRHRMANLSSCAVTWQWRYFDDLSFTTPCSVGMKINAYHLTNSSIKFQIKSN